MKTLGRIVDISVDYITKKPKITTTIEDIYDTDELEMLSKLDLINIDLSKITKKRKLSQNDLSWVLQKKLAEKLNLGNEELHEMMIKEYSEYNIISMLSDINPKNYFDYYDIIDVRKGQNGKDYTFYKVYVPSRNMDTIQFGRFMDGIIKECEENGISTIKE